MDAGTHLKPVPPVSALPQSHAGKVVLRSWYEKNKHIFPASRWEPYDPEKKWDKYTVRVARIHGCNKLEAGAELPLPAFNVALRPYWDFLTGWRCTSKLMSVSVLGFQIR